METKFKLTKQDEDIICDLAQYIFDTAKTLTLRNIFSGDTLKTFLQEHTGYQLNMKKRKKGEGYSFLGENEVDIALNLFFANEYNCKRIAKELYLLEEDDYIIETMDIEIPIGECVLSNKALFTSNVFEIIIKVRPYRDYKVEDEEEEYEEEEYSFPYSLNKNTKLPFDIIKIAVAAE